jgi:hypothetical protein
VLDIYEIRRHNLRAIARDRYPRAGTALAVQLGFSTPGLLYRLLNGSKPIGGRLARKIESVVGVPANWLDQPPFIADEPTHPSDPLSSAWHRPPPLAVRESAAEYSSDAPGTPLIPWELLPRMVADPSLDPQSIASDWVTEPRACGTNLIALQVLGDHMAGPEDGYRNGDVIWVDRGRRPANHDDVIVALADGRALMRRLQSTNEGLFLKALNHGLRESLWPLPPGATILGVVVFSGRARHSALP